MGTTADKTHSLLLISRDKFWLEKSRETLMYRDQWSVHLHHLHRSTDLQKLLDEVQPELTILYCSQMSSDEYNLIQSILTKSLRVVVQCPDLPWGDMRRLFLHGVSDATDDPTNPNALFELIDNSIAEDTIPAGD